MNRIGRYVTAFGLSLIGALAYAQDGQVSASHHAPPSGRPGGPLVDIVRQATEKYRDVRVAQADGYTLTFGCVSGGEIGAMGMHFVNFDLVGDGEIDPTKPEIVIYEPLPGGRLKLIGADYLVLADQWNAKHPGGAPEMMGQLFHLFEAPNRFGLPSFYTLHVWAWKENPTGTFVNWHTNVSCEAFGGQGQ